MIVFRDRRLGCWVSRCSRHNDEVITSTWADAMEAAWGHVVMAHPRPVSWSSLCPHCKGYDVPACTCSPEGRTAP